MQILKHPTFEGHTVEVADDKVDRWVAAGWTRADGELEPEPEDESSDDTDFVEFDDIEDGFYEFPKW